MSKGENVFSRIYGLNMQLQDSVHVIRQAMDNARWHECLLGLRDVHRHVRVIGDLLAEVEPEGYAQLLAELHKLLPMRTEAEVAADAATKQEQQEQGRVATSSSRAK